MNKQSLRTGLIGAAVVVLIVAVAWLLRSGGPLPQTPGAAVDAFFDAAERGDDREYLRVTAGELRKELDNRREQLGVAAFREHLKDSQAKILGLTKFEPDSVIADSVALEVELVFKDHKQRQTMHLRPEGTGWVITLIETAQRIESPIAYGTPVYEVPTTETPTPGQPAPSSR